MVLGLVSICCFYWRTFNFTNASLSNEFELQALVPVIKGDYPLTLDGFNLLCQLVAVFTVGYAVKTGLTSYQR